MKRNEHEKARELIALAGAREEDLFSSKKAWLHAHLRECAACRDYAEAARGAIRALRSQPVAADSSLVRATQMRVRSRALELRQHRERMWVIYVCCAAVTLGTTVTTALVWRGFEWIGHEAQLPVAFWQIGLLTLGLLPGIVAGVLLLARGTYLADHRGTL
jgi:predicted anti-sigma-YlaC factor YlaD